jgi:hypothetical protein
VRLHRWNDRSFSSSPASRACGRFRRPLIGAKERIIN